MDNLEYIKVKARVVAPQGNNALTVRWLLDVKEGYVAIGGPRVNSVPVDIVPFDLRAPNKEFIVVFSYPGEVSHVERISDI